MARVKRGVASKKRHKKVLKQAKGYYGNKSRSFRAANEQVMRSGNYAFRDRRARKGEMRRLWIQRINAACRLARHELQPVHRRAERRRHRSRPQDPRRSRGDRCRCVQQAGRERQSCRSTDRPRLGTDECAGVQQSTSSATAAPDRAPQFALGRRSVRRRGAGARRRGGRRRLDGRSAVRRRGSDGVIGDGAGEALRARRGRLRTGRLRPKRRSRRSPSSDADHVDAAEVAGRRHRSWSCSTGIGDPGNLGTILRSAEAAGVDLVVLTAGSRRPVQPEGRPLVGRRAVPRPGGDGRRSTTWPRPARARRHQQPRLRRVAPSCRYTDADLTGRIALVMGNEAAGLPDDWNDSAGPIRRWVTIPHRGRSESLNVAMATTVLVFEAARQRDQASENGGYRSVTSRNAYAYDAQGPAPDTDHVVEETLRVAPGEQDREPGDDARRRTHRSTRKNRTMKWGMARNHLTSGRNRFRSRSTSSG